MSFTHFLVCKTLHQVRKSREKTLQRRNEYNKKQHDNSLNSKPHTTGPPPPHSLVPRPQPRECPPGRGQVVSHPPREVQEPLRHDGADDVRSPVLGLGAAGSVAEPAGQGRGGAGPQGGSQDVGGALEGGRDRFINLPVMILKNVWKAWKKIGASA